MQHVRTRWCKDELQDRRHYSPKMCHIVLDLSRNKNIRGPVSRLSSDSKVRGSTPGP